MTKNGLQTRKAFWEINQEIMFAVKDIIVTEKNKLLGIFNDHYINIVECSHRTKPTNVA